MAREKSGRTTDHAAATAFVASPSATSRNETRISLSGSSRIVTSPSVTHQPFDAVNVAPDGVVIGVSSVSWRVLGVLGGGGTSGTVAAGGGGGGGAGGGGGLPPQATA